MEIAHNIEAVFRELHPRLWKGLFAFTGSADLASDAEAEAFTQAIKRGNEIRDLESWVWASAYRIAAGLLAKRAKEQAPIEPQQSVEDASIIELVDLLSDLSDQQRIVVILRYVGGYKPTEVAELLGTSAGTVRVQLHRAHESLRQLIGSTND